MNSVAHTLVFVGLMVSAWASTSSLAWAQTSAPRTNTPDDRGTQGIVSQPPNLPSEDAVRGALATGAAEHLASPKQQELLGEWMEYTAANGRRTRLSSGANQLIASSIGMAIGIVLFVTSPSTELSKGVGLALVGSSGAFMAVGIVQLAKESQAELRLERWNRAARSRLTLQELGRFEGELRAQAETVDRATKASRWSSFGLAITGGLILGLTPAANLSSDASTGSYIAGGVMAGAGLLGFGLSFIGVPENAYEAYRRGQRPLSYSRRAMVRASPALGRRFIGAQVIGRF